ncbi:LOW QUALITY PROTEIN: hypothetical protein HID58_067414 [Brassica napus]|uniref:Uncharacterized protein n=1 Tax=Brassica napus TaxID=3708 RepID=A0ABQ7ZIF9_BRANA|nr:LOW QUALITY PROTEIN: hypothetical protein HID58_067414 [Brassica napus]
MIERMENVILGAPKLGMCSYLSSKKILLIINHYLIQKTTHLAFSMQHENMKLFNACNLKNIWGYTSGAAHLLLMTFVLYCFHVSVIESGTAHSYDEVEVVERRKQWNNKKYD